VNALDRAPQLLQARLEALEVRLRNGDETAWPEYHQVIASLAAALSHVTPGARGELLTTEEMARRLAVTTKTLLRRKARGDIRPALQRGKLIRWRGDEAPR
jgi:hypothetical protein